MYPILSKSQWYDKWIFETRLPGFTRKVNQYAFEYLFGIGTWESYQDENGQWDEYPVACSEKFTLWCDLMHSIRNRT